VSLGVENTTTAQNASFWVRSFSEAQKLRKVAKTLARRPPSESHDAQTLRKLGRNGDDFAT
jgi:hypothetical protein